MKPSILSNGWQAPACAWRRPLGDRPAVAEQVVDAAGIFDTPARTKKGIPLGGIGAGNFMYNLAGSFGPWHMVPGRYEERFLPQAAFHVYEKSGEAPATVRTLATEDVLPAWSRLQVGEGTYSALFPRGWVDYTAFQSQVSLIFFSPIIRENYRETSLPVAIFLFQVENPTDRPLELAVMFTFPNAPLSGPHALKAGPAGEGQGRLERAMNRLARERKGLSNQVVQDDDLTALILSASSPDNPPETQGSEWCLATSAAATFNPCWDGAGDGADIWAEFARAGELGGQATAAQTDLPGGALACKVALQPGERRVIPYVLSWHFPQVGFASGTRWYKKYTEFFGVQPGGAAALAGEALAKYADWLHAVEDWTGAIVNNPAYPDWLKQGALNELYYATFGGSFWENGCATKPKTFGGRPDQQLSFVMECQEYRFAETFDVRHHTARSNRDLWPKLERDILLAYADFIIDNPAGACPHDAGSPDDDPYFVYDAYALFDPAATDPSNRKFTQWSEYAPKFIQQCYAYWRRAADDAFLRDVWPAMLKTFDYQRTTDTNGDGLTELKSSEYRDNKFFNAVLWIGALEMLVEIARYLDYPDWVAKAAAELALARKSTEEQFWSDELGYYRFNGQKDYMMGDAMIGQLYVDVTGLPPTLTPERMTSHYRKLFRINVQSQQDTDGDGVGNLGVANAVYPDGSPGEGASDFAHEYEVWTGVSYAAAASLYHWGKQIQDGALQAAALLTGWGVYQQTWRRDETAYWFSTPEAWRLSGPTQCRALMYQRPRGIWELLMAIQDPFL